MGRTVLPFSRVLEQEIQEWRKFRRGLRKEDQQFLDRLFEEARLHVQAGVYASRPWPFETILVSILLEHEKTLVELRSKVRVLEETKECTLSLLPSLGGRGFTPLDKTFLTRRGEEITLSNRVKGRGNKCLFGHPHPHPPPSRGRGIVRVTNLLEQLQSIWVDRWNFGDGSSISILWSPR